MKTRWVRPNIARKTTIHREALEKFAAALGIRQYTPVTITITTNGYDRVYERENISECKTCGQELPRELEK